MHDALADADGIRVDELFEGKAALIRKIFAVGKWTLGDQPKPRVFTREVID